MPNALIQTRISEEIKTEAATTLAAIGLTVSDAVRILLTRIAHEKKVPVELFTPNATTRMAMEEAEKNDLETTTLDDIREIIS